MFKRFCIHLYRLYTLHFVALYSALLHVWLSDCTSGCSMSAFLDGTQRKVLLESVASKITLSRLLLWICLFSAALISMLIFLFSLQHSHETRTWLMFVILLSPQLIYSSCSPMTRSQITVFRHAQANNNNVSMAAKTSGQHRSNLASAKSSNEMKLLYRRKY